MPSVREALQLGVLEPLTRRDRNYPESPRAGSRLPEQHGYLSSELPNRQTGHAHSRPE
jgi:hypothetical protein